MSRNEQQHEVDKSDDLMMISIKDQYGNEVECSVISVFEHNRRDYIALMPDEKDENGEFSILIYRYSIQENEEGIQLYSITSDMEYDEVINIFSNQIENNIV